MKKLEGLYSRNFHEYVDTQISNSTREINDLNKKINEIREQIKKFHFKGKLARLLEKQEMLEKERYDIKDKVQTLMKFKTNNIVSDDLIEIFNNYKIEEQEYLDIQNNLLKAINENIKTVVSKKRFYDINLPKIPFKHCWRTFLLLNVAYFMGMLIFKVDLASFALSMFFGEALISLISLAEALIADEIITQRSNNNNQKIEDLNLDKILIVTNIKRIEAGTKDDEKLKPTVHKQTKEPNEISKINALKNFAGILKNIRDQKMKEKSMVSSYQEQKGKKLVLEKKDNN